MSKNTNDKKVTKLKRKLHPDTANKVKKKARLNKLRDDIINVHELNAEKNSKTTQYNKARQKLLGDMTEEGLTELACDGLLARVDTPERSSIDIAKLWDKCTKEQLLEMVSASSASVTKVMGAAVAASCLVSKQGTTTVSIKKH